MNKHWTESDKKFIREQSDKMKDVDLAQVLTKRKGKPISLHALRKLRVRLGIKKPAGRPPNIL